MTATIANSTSRGSRPFVRESRCHLQSGDKCGSLARMNSFTTKPRGIERMGSGSTLPSSISDLTLRDMAWAVAGAMLAYLVTLI